MVKGRKYEPIDDTLDASISLWQAACALEEAAKIALDTKDTEKLILISDGWVNIAQHLLTEMPPSVDDDEDEEVHTTEPIKIGFSANGRVGHPESDD